MKTWIRTGAALVVFLCLGASASGATCTPIPPKDTQGHIEFVHQGASAAVAAYEKNGCSWNGLDQTNGSDGLVLDVTGQSGTATMTATLGSTALISVVIQGHFLDANCTVVDGADWHAATSLESQPLSELVTIPANAKYLVVDSTNANAGNDISVLVHSDGQDCVVVKKKKHHH